MTRQKALVLALMAAAVVAFFALDLGRHLSLETLRAERDALAALRSSNPGLAEATFFGVYVLVTALSLPGAAILTLAAGALFGLGRGTLLVSFASSLGATLAFLLARFVLRDWVRARFPKQLEAIDHGVEHEGAYYLFTLRLVPLFPFFLVNLLSGLTSLRPWKFYWVSQVGMLAGTAMYVNAGTRLASVESASDVLSPTVIASFALLGVFPLVAKRMASWLRARRVYAGWKRPRHFDRNLVVIGAGSAGLVTSYIAALLRAKVTLIEKHKMGGDCLNTGCVPSKALIRTAKLLSHVARAKELGVREASARADFADVMERVQRVVRAVAPHDSVERYTSLGVEVLEGSAKITSPWSVEITTDGGTKALTTRSIVIAAGARPFVPPIPGLAEAGYLTSDDLWELRVLPPRLVVLGGGPIGSELSQAFARLGSRVTQVEMAPRLLPREDSEVSELVAARFRSEGIDVRLSHRAKRVELERDNKILVDGACRPRGAHRVRPDPGRGRSSRTRRGLWSRGHRGRRRADGRGQRVSPDALSQHLRGRRRRWSVPVHTHGGAPGLVRGSERALRSDQEVPRGLLGHPVGNLHRSGGGAGRLERARGEGEEDRLTKSRATTSRSSTARLPTKKRTASSRCSPSPVRTASWASRSSASTRAISWPSSCSRCGTASA